MKYKFIPFLIFCFLSALSGSEFFSYFAKYTEALYSEREFVHTQYAVTNGWNRICSAYSEIYDYRINRNSDIPVITDKIEDLISSLKKNRIKKITPYENEFLTASLYGSLAYLGSEDPSFGMLRTVNKAAGLFSKLEESYRTADSEFGAALADIATGLYFENSFWAGTVFRKKGNISKGIVRLNRIASEGEITGTESGLFLIEYYADILNDHSSSLKYSESLNKAYPESRYFMYLYAKDLYHTGNIRNALKLFSTVNGSLSDRFCTFDYESVIYEAKCLYLLNEKEKAGEVIRYASDIHDGYILDKFRNDWMYSVKIRQEAVFRVMNSPSGYQDLSADEQKRIIAVYFDHGYFRELKRLSERLSDKDEETVVIDFRTAVIMNEWERAGEMIRVLENDHKKEFKNDTDRKRLDLLINITDNYIRNKKQRGIK